MAWLPNGEETLRTCVTFLTEYRRVTDGQTDKQTDGQTSCDSIVRAMHMRHTNRKHMQKNSLSTLHKSKV